MESLNLETTTNRYRLIITGPGWLGFLPRNWRTFVRRCTDEDASTALVLLNAWGIEARVEISE